MTISLGILSDLLNADGSFAFPGYSLRLLRHRERIAVSRVPGGTTLDREISNQVDFLISVPTATAIDGSNLAPGCRLAAILRVGVGCDDIDLSACTEAGVAVVIPTVAVTRPTAVAALTLMLALATRLIEKDRVTRQGDAEWHRRSDLQGCNLHGRVLGLVGCGAIGSQFASYALVLGMAVVAFDPALSPQDAERLGIRLAGIDEVLAGSDFISLHCPLNASTRHMINDKRLALVKPTACLINTSRGGLVDQVALYKVLSNRRLRGAALDVFEPEPLPRGEPLLALDNVIFSAHALNWTRELDEEIADENVQAINALLEGACPHKIANPAVLESGAYRRKLANLQSRLGSSGT